MFAISTPALITGACANRVTFKAYMRFLTVWLTLVYVPFVHMIWGGGILASWGVLDFAGEELPREFRKSQSDEVPQERYKQSDTEKRRKGSGHREDPVEPAAADWSWSLLRER